MEPPPTSNEVEYMAASDALQRFVNDLIHVAGKTSTKRAALRQVHQNLRTEQSEALIRVFKDMVRDMT